MKKYYSQAYKSSFIFLIVLLTLPFVLFTNKVFAQNIADSKVGFTLSPPSNEYESIQGGNLTGVVKISNLTDTTIQITAEAQSFVTYGDTGQVAIVEDNPTFSIKNWIKLDTKEKILKPRSETSFTYTIEIPKDAEPGSHYGAIVVSSKPPTIKGSTGAAVQQSIGSLILIKLPGDVSDETKLVNFKTDKDYYTDPKIKFNVLLENVGNVHTKVSGEINIFDLFNNKVKTLTIEGKNVLPNNKRVFDTETDFDLIGPYRAELVMKYGINKEITATTSFIALYLDKSLRILGVSLFVLVFYIIFRKRINKAVRVIIKG